MKIYIFLFLFAAFSQDLFCQNGQIFPDRIQVPNLNQTQISGLTDVSQGQVIFDMDNNEFKIYDGFKWRVVTLQEESNSELFKIAEVKWTNELWRAVRDKEGNLLVAGFLTDSTYLDNSLISNLSNNILLLKIGNDGSIIWQVRTGGSSLKTICDLKVDSTGNFYICGNFTSNIHFSSVSYSTNENDSDAFIAKFSASGSFLWAKRGTGVDKYSISENLTIDGQGNIIVSGNFEDSVQIEGIMLESSWQKKYFFCVKYSSSGELIFATNFGGESTQITSLSSSSEGNILLSGVYRDRIDYLDQYLTNRKFTEQNYLLQLNPDGSPDWLKSIEVSTFKTRPRSCYDSNNNIYFVSVFKNSSIQIDTCSVLIPISNQGHGFISKFDKDGELELFNLVAKFENNLNYYFDNIFYYKGEIHVSISDTYSTVLQGNEIYSNNRTLRVAKMNASTLVSNGIVNPLKVGLSVVKYDLGMDSTPFAFGKHVSGLSLEKGIYLLNTNFSYGYFYFIP